MSVCVSLLCAGCFWAQLAVHSQVHYYTRTPRQRPYSRLTDQQASAVSRLLARLLQSIRRSSSPRNTNAFCQVAKLPPVRPSDAVKLYSAVCFTSTQTAAAARLSVSLAKASSTQTSQLPASNRPTTTTRGQTSPASAAVQSCCTPVYLFFADGGGFTEMTSEVPNYGK